jgi:hypothetical protein
MSDRSTHTGSTKTKDDSSASGNSGHNGGSGSDSLGGRFDRISDQSKGLVDDVKDWVDLRVRLVQMDLEDRIDVIANQTILTLVIIGIGGASMFFGLFAAAFGLGLLFGNNALGFLAMSVLLAVVTVLMNYVRPRFINNALLNVAKKGNAIAAQDVKKQLESDELALKPLLPEAKKEVS